MPAGAVADVGTSGVKTRWTREEIVRLGRGPRSWEFLPVALRALAIAPHDAELRLLTAAHFARLGLRTAADEHRALLPGAIAGDAGVRELARAIEAIPEDRIEPEDLVAACCANVEALGARGRWGVDAGALVPRWAETLSAHEWFRARDGNVVRRRTGEPDGWVSLADHAGAAVRFAREHCGSVEAPSMITIEGADPPWVLLEVAKATARTPDGFQSRLVVVQADAGECLDGLAQADLRDVLGSDRTIAFVGPDCAARLDKWLRSRFESQLSGACIPLRSVRTRAAPPVEQVLERAREDQLAEHARLLEQVRAIYAGRDRAWWRERFGETERPLRVLVPTSRYSTFIRHSSADLVEACRAAGLEADLVIEPDSFSRLSSLALLRLIADRKPDLVVLINWTRATMRLPLPPELPFVCWVQDSMPQMLDARAGKEQGGLDFLVGHLHPELFSRFGYPRERAFALPVVASPRKFHPGPVRADLRERFECDIALVSHHSEAPEAMQARLIREAGHAPPLIRAMNALLPRIRAAVEDAAGTGLYASLERAAREELSRALGKEPEPQAATLVYRQYCLPLADRIMRHQTLDWAASIAERRGWRLHIHGRGWEGHPRFRAYARGELDHAEELRAAYQCAAVHVHVSAHTLTHQRVMECALSGGLPLCRVHDDALAGARRGAQRELALGRHPDLCDLRSGRPGYRVADSPTGMALTALRQRLGLPAEDILSIGQQEREELAAYEYLCVPENDPTWLLGDLAEVGFVNAEQFEERVGLMLESPARRAGLSERIARRVRERLSHDVLVRRIVGLVRGSLNEPGGNDEAGGSGPDGLPGPETMRTAASRHERLRRSSGAHCAVRSRFGAAPDDAAVRRVAEYYAPPAWAQGAIAIEDAMFLYDMVWCLRPRRVVEVGVASGVSGAMLLRALADSGVPLVDEAGSPALHSFDLHPFCFFDRARPVGGAAAEMAPGLARGLSLHIRKTAADAAEMFAAEPLSLAFIDADHRHPWPTADVLALLPALRPGAWVVLHDIELPEYARRHEGTHGSIVDWHQAGAQRLFDGWPFEKLRGVEGAFNIGAIRIPDDRPVTRADLQRVIDTPWETTPDPRALRTLGRDVP